MDRVTGVSPNNVSALSLAEAEVLIGEIERLRGEVAKLEARLSRLRQLAYQDTLVDLPNRRSFLSGLERLVSRVEQYGNSAAILFIDVDGMKEINDTFGHSAGDQALVEVARILAGCVRKADRVARLGGDEFGVLLQETDELGAWHMGLRIVETVVGSQFCVNGTRLPLSVAVGVGVIEAGDDARSVIDRADKEMYRIKTA